MKQDGPNHITAVEDKRTEQGDCLHYSVSNGELIQILIFHLLQFDC